MNPMTRTALISDLFFNYQHGNYDKAVASDTEKKGAPSGAIEEAIAKDAKHFADCYFELLAETKEFSWPTKEKFVEWLTREFFVRL